MGSLMDWGHNQREQEKTKATKCPNSPNGEHDWKMKGSYPSSWGECIHCKTTFYNK